MKPYHQIDDSLPNRVCVQFLDTHYTQTTSFAHCRTYYQMTITVMNDPSFYLQVKLRSFFRFYQSHLGYLGLISIVVATSLIKKD